MKTLFKVLTFGFAALFFLLLFNTQVFAQADVPADGTSIELTVSLVANGILLVVSAFFGFKISGTGEKLGKANMKVEQVKALIDTLQDAIADDRISPEEVSSIVKAAKAIFK